MRKLHLILLVSMLVIALASPAGSNEEREFMLAGANGAYASFTDDGCTVEVGYVEAALLRFFDTNETHQPHSDLQVIISGTCDAKNQDSVVPTAFDPLAQFSKLDQTSIDGIRLPLLDGHAVVVDLTWTAHGDIDTTQPEGADFQMFKMRDADVSGTITLCNSECVTWFEASKHLQPGANIVFYNEISRHSGP